MRNKLLDSGFGDSNKPGFFRKVSESGVPGDVQQFGFRNNCRKHP
jgi:hypothetical protein